MNTSRKVSSMKNESPLPSRKEYHRKKATKNKRPATKEKDESELPSLILIRVLTLVFIGMVTLFLLYSYFL